MIDTVDSMCISRAEQWYQTRLPGGLRVLTIQRPGSQLVAIAACARAGSRHEDAARGTFHVLEHLLMGGTQHRSALAIHDAVDRVGGDLNAHTGKEYMSFYCVLPAPHWLVGLEVLTEILLSPSLHEQALAREKAIILEEIARSTDESHIIFSLFARTLWQSHPLRHPILGSAEQVAALTHEDLLRAYQRHLTACNMVVVVCGDLEHNEICDRVHRMLGSLPPGEEIFPVPALEPAWTGPRLAHLARKVTQVSLMLGVPTVGVKDPDRSALKVIERILGMGIGARLYRRLRDELRLVYGVTTATAHYEDTGYLAARTACRPTNVESVCYAILEEMAALARDGVGAEELDNAQANYAGTLARRFETNLSIASIAAVEALLHQMEPIADSIARIRAVTRDDVQRVAARYLNTGAYALATVGPESTWEE